MKYYIKKFAGTLIAGWILFLLLAYLYFFELKRPVEDDQKTFIGFKESQIDEIRLEYPSHSVVARKEGNRWFVVKRSKKYKAESETITGMIGDFAKMKIDKVVSEVPDGLTEYGLENPRVEVVMKTPEKRHRLRVGKESPVSSGAYAQADYDRRVVLVDRNSLWRFLDKSADDLRDKQILSLDKDRIERLRFRAGDSSFEVEKKNGRWVGRNIPQYIEVDQDKVEGVVQTFSDLRVVGFVDDRPKDLAQFGLDVPNAELVLFQNGKSAHLLFSNEKKGDYYTKLTSEDPVYSISEFTFNRMPKGVNDIRVRNVIKFDTESVSGLDIKGKNAQISVIKKEGVWKIKGDEGVEIDESKIYELLEEMKSLRVDQFIEDNLEDLAPFGLAEPEIQLSIWEGDLKTT
ncbi:MAG TPA: DUF4340 domain-containing protein, partial [Thermodesulfobacteriota bacterium]|nr:DUF4340 domain-containing protein [Thermodesulfobacteriota bacterium]